MPKAIAASLQTDIRRNVTTLATCVLITRRDGKPYRLTSHDESIEFEGFTYRHDVPFIIGAIDSGSQMAIDNTELTLFADDTVFSLSAFESGLFDHAEVEVFLVDYETPSHGRMTMRRGWFGKVVRDKQKMVRVTLTGLLKVLDFETGRIYQPTCDADFGDSRCKVAVNHNQIWSPYNYYGVGDWVFRYDPALMTAITLTNGSFESDGVVNEGDPITGWTQSDGATFFVNTVNQIPGGASVSALAPGAGTYALFGGTDATASSSGAETFLYQDVDLVAAGLDAGDIDDGQISLGLFSMVAQSVYLLDPARLKIELTDSSGNFVAAFDSRWMFLDDNDSWRERAVVCPIYPTARYAHIYLMTKKEEGAVPNVAFDNVRLYWWNHTLGNPYDDAIHRCTRVLNFANGEEFRPPNSSFEANGLVAGALDPTIRSWTTDGWWRVDNDLGSGGEQLIGFGEGSYYLTGADDSSGVQRTNNIEQTFDLSTVPGLNAARVVLGKYVSQCNVDVGFAGPGDSTATVLIEMLNSSNVVVDDAYIMNNENFAGADVGMTKSARFTIPATCTKIRTTLSCTSPIGDGFAKVAFDKVQFFFYDAERPVRTDLLLAQPLSTSELDPTVGTFTLDNALVWKATQCFTLYDTVATVTDRKTFTGTTISGTDGTYETGTIWWISGQNAGLKNVIRIWNSGDKSIKLYFRQPFPITVGDRFIYVRSCQRRFTEDCSLVFQNAINFRGFPVLPGKLRVATAAENAAE